MIPTQLQKPEFRFIKVHRHGKEPIEKGWTTTANYNYDSLTLKEWIDAGNNYGVVCGLGNLLVIDFDDKEFLERFIEKFPETFTVKSGGKGLHHLYYIIDSIQLSFDVNEKYHTFDVNKKYADVQCKGKMVIGAGSVHASGKTYEVIKDIPLTHIDYAEIKAIFSDYIKKEKRDISDDKNIIQNYRQNRDIVDDIKSKIKISNVLGEFNISTSKNPTECPMHTSKGGKCLSFDDNKGVWHCFDCNNGGDIFTLMQEGKRYDFKEALYELSEKAGINRQQIMSQQRQYQQQNNSGTGSSGGRGNSRSSRKNNADEFEEIQENARILIDDIPYLMDEEGIRWRWNSKECRYEENVDKLTVIIDIDRLFGAMNSLQSYIRNAYLIAIDIEARDKAKRIIPKKDSPEDLERQNVIQFKDTVVNIRTGKKWRATSDEFYVNPIPHSIGDTEDMPFINKLLEQWCPGRSKQLKDIIAYHCISNNPNKLIFFYYGQKHDTGKSQFLNLLRRFLGHHNVMTSTFAMISDSSVRFEIASLRNKLALFCSEIEKDAGYGKSYSTNTLKTLSGMDEMRGEIKGIQKKINFTFYGKTNIACNDLPEIRNVDDEPFYGRCAIIDFNQNFKRTLNPITFHIPPEEFSNLALYCCNRCIQWMNDGKITIYQLPERDDRVKIFMDKCNPMISFFNTFVEVDDSTKPEMSDWYILCWEFRNKFNDYLNERGISIWGERKIINMFNNDFKDKIYNTKITINDIYSNIEKRIRCYKGIRWRKSPLISGADEGDARTLFSFLINSSITFMELKTASPSSELVISEKWYQNYDIILAVKGESIQYTKDATQDIASPSSFLAITPENEVLSKISKNCKYTEVDTNVCKVDIEKIEDSKIDIPLPNIPKHLFDKVFLLLHQKEGEKPLILLKLYFESHPLEYIEKAQKQQIQYELLKLYIEKHPLDNANDIDNIFSNVYVEQLKKVGDLYEIKPGTYKLL